MKKRYWLIEKRGSMTQEQAAKLCGVSRSTYGSYEAGRRTPRYPEARKAAEALGFDWQLFFDPDCVESPQKVG